MDLQMPHMYGITAIEHLRQEHPEIAIAILTTYNEDDLMIRGLRAGARGFLLKDSSRENLLDAIHAAVRGETLLKQEILARVLMPQNQFKSASVPQADFTPTERAGRKSCMPSHAANATKKSPTPSASLSGRSKPTCKVSTKNSTSISVPRQSLLAHRRDC